MRHRATTLLVFVPLLSASLLAGCVADDGGDDPDDPGGENKKRQEQERGSISGSVEGWDGPLSGVSVDLSRVFRTTTSDAQGAFRFEDLLPGDYRVTLRADYYDRKTVDVALQEGQDVDLDVELELSMLSEGVPRKFGKSVTYANAEDILLVSGGAGDGLLPVPGPETTVTNETKNNTFPGFWPVKPEEGYWVAQVDVLVYRLDVPLPEEPPEEPPKANLSVRYFRGESPAENELVETPMVNYHAPDPLLAQGFWWFYRVANDDWSTWGPRTWQVGVFVEDTSDIPAGGGVTHLVQVVATLVAEEYATAVS